MGGALVQAISVVANQDPSFSAFADSEIDGSGGAGYQRDERGLVAFTDDPQHPVPSLEAMTSMLVSQASVTRSPFSPSRTARTGWARAKRSA